MDIRDGRWLLELADSDLAAWLQKHRPPGDWVRARAPHFFLPPSPKKDLVGEE